MIRIFLAVVFLLIVINSANSQNNKYILQRNQSAYTELIGDTTIYNLQAQPNGTFRLNFLNKTFNFMNKSYRIDNTTTYIDIGENGYINVSDLSTDIFFDGLTTDLDSIDATSKITYKLDWVNNEEVLKVQWKNMTIAIGVPGNYVNFQMWWYTATETIEIHYGPSSVNNHTGYSDTAGPFIGMFYVNKAFTNMLEKIWLTDAPPTYIIDSTRNLNLDPVHGIPVSETVLKFIPLKYALNVSILNSNEDIVVAPNPSYNEINIKLLKNQASPVLKTVQIIDLNGRVLNEYQLNTDNNFINVSHIPNGSYLLKISNKSIYKILIKR